MTLKNIPIWTQSFKQLIKNNLLYVDKTEQIYKLLSSGNNYYYISRPRRWGKSLTIDTMQEIFIGNKDLFKGLYIYDKWDWAKTYPVIVISFAGYNTEQNNQLTQYLEEKTVIYIDNKEYKISDFLGDKPLTNLQYLIEAVNKKTWKEIVILIDEYDSPFTKNLNNEENFNKIKSFFSVFYSAVKDLGRYLRFFYLSWLTKVAQTSLFSTMNNLDNISYDENFYTLMWYTKDEIKNFFKSYIPIVSEKINLKEEELFQELAEWYDGYYFGGEKKLYNPWSINSFFKKWEFSDYWRQTGMPSLIEQVFIKPTMNISTMLEKIENKDLQIDLDWMVIENIDNAKSEGLLLQSWYLTIEPIWPQKFLKIANKETKNALYNDLKDFVRKRKELNFYVKNLDLLYEAINTKNEKLLETSLNNIESDNNPASEWFNRNPEGYFKWGLERDLRLAWFDIITKEEANKNGRCDLVIYHKEEVFIIEAKIWWQKEAEETAINQIDEKYASSYKYKNLIKIWIAWDKNKDKKVYVKIIQKQ